MRTNMEKTNDAWLGELTVELRLRDVTGRDIGDAVASAREFLADAGIPADEAFGPAGEYAAALDLHRAPDATAGLRRAVMGGLASLLGFFAVVFAAPSVIRGDELALSVSILVLTAFALILIAAAPAYLRYVVRSRAWKIMVAVGVIFAFQLIVSVLFGGIIVAAVPALPVAVVGGIVLIGTALWTQFRQQDDADPVTEPLASDGRVAAGPGGRAVGGSAAAHRLLSVFPTWLLVGMAVIFVAIDVLLLGA